MRLIAIGRAAAALALVLAAGVHPVAAQEVSPEACADAKEQVRYLENEGAFVQDAGLKNGVDLLGNATLLRNAACGTQGDDSPPPLSTDVVADDITACLPMSNIQTLLGRPTKFHAGDGPQHANFTGPSGATLQIERVPSDGAASYQLHMDAGLSDSCWQLAGVDGLGDQAFAANRGGDSRSLVILQGDAVWLLHMDGIPAGRGYPQLRTIAGTVLSTCP